MNLGELERALADAGVELFVEETKLRYRAPRGALSESLRLAIGEHRADLVRTLGARSSARIPRDDHHRNDPFPLTPLQQAYWVGEQGLFEAAGAGYFYQEYRVDDLDVARFRRAVAALVARHEVMRLVIEDGGAQQRFADPTPLWSSIPCIEHLDRGGAQAEATMVELRAKLADRLPSLSDGRPVSFSVVRFADQVRIGIVIRLIAADGVSLDTLYGDLVALYNGTELEDRSSVPSYRDYVLSRVAHTHSQAYRRSLDYWTARLDTLPGPPQLPVASSSRLDDAPVGAGLRRRHGVLDAERWRRLQERARRAGLPINSLLCSLFVDCLRRWSSEDRFTVNVLVANRPPADPEVDRIVGNCSSTALLEIAPANGATVIERARQLQGQLYADLQHADVPGVTVIRELARRRPPDGRPPMPVVFTSGIGLTRDFRGFSLGVDGWKLVHSALRTPQVWLDHQVYEESGALSYNWDFEPRALDASAVDAMFACYEALLAELAAGESEAAWNDPEVPRLPAEEVRERDAANATDAPAPTGNLISALLTHVELTHVERGGDAKLAVVDPDRSLRYGDLLNEASCVAGGLRRLGVQPGDLVAIYLEKGFRQAAAVIGVHLAGAAYVPVDAGAPPARLEQIVRHAGVRALIARDSKVGAGVPILNIDADRDLDALAYGIAPQPSAGEDLAYVIYTSGSTGAPKGVAMDHGAALNTLVDVRARFGLDASDRVLAVSSLAFDLSVYDLFATFAVGATLVYPRPSAHPDPQALADAVREHRVTVWNSVPALLELTCEFLGDRVSTELASLRLIMLSGDWIPLSLAALVRERLPNARLVSLGGATEAAVWSNYHEVDQLDPAWTSIPYGVPLTNQRLQVLDGQLRSVPRGVVGDLYISGLGLARGYHRAPELTAASFLTHPRTGERLYRTGDLARYREAGLIEFLGRSDSQVKIGGFRIELGEIETHLRRLPGVETAVVLATTAATRGAIRKLVAFVVEDGTSRFDPESAREELLRRLPHYMVPTRIEIVSSIPLSANGKVDRRRLEAGLTARAVTTTSRPSTQTEARLAAIWAELLGIDDVNRDADFFALGGDSLRAVRLFHRIQREFGLRLPLDSLFEHGSVGTQGKVIDERVSMSTQACIRLRAGKAGITPLFLFPPVGGAIFCYRPLLEALPADTPVHGFRAWGLEPGEQPLESVPAMCDRYLPRIRELAPAGRAMFAGWSMGGIVALHAARAFTAAGGVVQHVLAVDSWVDDERAQPSDETRDFHEFVSDLGGLSSGTSDDLESPATLSEPLRRAFAVFRANARALRACPAPARSDAFPVTYVEAVGSSSLHRWKRPFEERRWRDEAQRWQRLRVDADHYTVMTSDGVRQYEDALRETSE